MNGEIDSVVTVVVPATSANLGPGFDALGLALGLYDEVSVRVVAQPGLSVEVDGEGAAQLPRDGSHLVARALLAALDRFGAVPPGLAVRCVNAIPQGRGLGSSAAAIVAGVLAGAKLAQGQLAQGERPVEQPEVLALASELEGHPDNVAACLLGGFTIAWTDQGSAHAVRLDPAPGLEAVVFVPSAGLATSMARGLLPPTVPHRDAAHAAGRAALLVEALTRRPELLMAATEDRLHQPYRAPAMVASAALVERLRADGVPAVVSGAGPSVLALGVGGAPSAVEGLAGPDWAVHRLGLDLGGARASSTPG